MKKLQFSHYGFHGRTRLSFMDTGIHRNIVEGKNNDCPVLYVAVSEHVANRLNKEVCGSINCKCGEKIAQWDAESQRYWVRIPSCGQQKEESSSK